MRFGLYAPIPMVTVGSERVAEAARIAHRPLPPGTRDIQFDVSLQLLKAAENVGFDLTLFAERHLGTDLEAWILASAISSHLDTMQALIAVHPGLWDPVLIAKMTASLDRICKGGVALNVVHGWFDREFEMFGGRVISKERRYRCASEFIEVMRCLWTEGRCSFSGEFYERSDAELLLRPARAEPPEVFSVSTGEEGRRFIAENCDWWFVDMAKDEPDVDSTLRAIEASINDMRKRAEQAQRTVRFAVNPFLAFGSDVDSALKDIVERTYSSETDPDPLKVRWRMLPATRAGCIGPPAAVRRQVQRFQDMGVELMLLKMIPDVRTVELVGSEVIDFFRSA